MSRIKFSAHMKAKAAKRLLVPGATCHICGRALDMTLRGLALPDSPSIDHVIPRSRGGGSNKENLLPAHRRCNERKDAS